VRVTLVPWIGWMVCKTDEHGDLCLADTTYSDFKLALINPTGFEVGRNYLVELSATILK